MIPPMADERWVLAYDRGCVRCTRLAAQIEAIAGGRLEVRPLDSLEVAAVRQQVFGSDPPWEPTLLAFGDDGVRAWTGPGLVMRLARLLGLRRALSVLGELGSLGGGRSDAAGKRL